MVSFQQDRCGGQTPGVQEGKQGNGLGSDCSGSGLERSQVGKRF